MRRLSVSARCALASLGVVLLLGCALSVAVDHVVRDQATAEASRSAELVAAFVARALPPGAVDRPALTGPEIAVLDDVVGNSDELRSLRVWGPEGRVLYDSEGRVTGSVQSVGPMLTRAYAGQIASHREDEPSAEGPSGTARLLEVYVPLTGADQTDGVVEVYLSYDRTAARSEQATRTLAGLLAAGLAALWALLWWLSQLVTAALRRTAAEQEVLARTDPLTGLPNRRALVRAVDVARAGPGCAVLSLGLDRFEEVRDTLGHEIGDRLLREVGERLAGELPDGALVARLGGDEFGVLLPRTTRAADAVLAASRLADALARPVELDALVLLVQASTGIALAPQHATSSAALLQRADIARAAAKQLGSGGVAVYDPDRDSGAADRVMLLAELQQGLVRGELSLAYQPCWDLDSGQCLAVEALVRWDSPRRGPVSPVDFVPICERSSLVRDLTAFVLDEALRQVRVWEDAGTVLNVAVNLSAANLAEEDLPQQVAELLVRHGVPADRLVLEITESAVIVDAQCAARVLDELVALGVDIAIDDFGTGYSSMSRLLELPLSALKVDRSFVADLPHGPGAAVVAATTRLAHDLGLFVVAEGVETPEQLAELVRLGCDVGQGYLLGRPMSPAAVPDAVRSPVARPVGLAV